jgi:iron complex outermembrane receptor protein
MLLVPAQTASLSLAWTEKTWSASVLAARARDWINYDRLALLNDLAASDGDISGADLREYWRRYDGRTHLSAAVTRQLTQRFMFTLTGSNLLDVQIGEPDNITIVPGRTLSLGIRARF